MTEQDIKNIKHLVLMVYSVLPLGALVLRSYHSSGTNVSPRRDMLSSVSDRLQYTRTQNRTIEVSSMCKHNNERSLVLLDSKICRCNSMSDRPADYMMDKTHHKSGLNQVSKTELCDILAIGEYDTVTGCHHIPTVCDL